MGLHRKRQQHFPGILFALLRPQPHGHGREKNAHQNGYSRKKGPHVGTEKGEEWGDKEPHTQTQKDDQKDVTNGRRIIGREFASEDRPKVLHLGSCV